MSPRRGLQAARLLLALALCLGTAQAEDRYVRYRLISPAADSAASLAILPHAESAGISIAAEPIELPGAISLHGLFVPAGQWSEWRLLPAPPVWGTVYLKLRSAEPLPTVDTEVQLATSRDARDLVRTMRIASSTGSAVGFVLPVNVLATPEQVETLEEGLLRRRKLAESVAVPEARRPKLLSVSPAGIRTEPTIADGQKRDFETAALLGFNTAELTSPGADGLPAYRFRSAEGTGRSEEADRARLAPSLQRINGQPIRYSMMVDEPGWEEGFQTEWKKSGPKGFEEFLSQAGVKAAELGYASLDQAPHLDRHIPVAADAPIARRRLWYWSCRYTYELAAQFFKRLSETTSATLPGAASTVNFSDHTIILGRGTVAGGGPDFFSLGRRDSLGMYWAEDWMFWKFTSWGNGLYQRIPYIASLLRGAARLHQPHPKLGYYIVSVGYRPGEEGLDRTTAARLLLLLGRGVKTFSYYNYGPTSRGTIDFWSDDAPVVRGVADGLGLIGDPVVEPLLAEGEPAPAQTCLLYSTPAEYWQSANGADADNQEKQFLYAMLGQGQAPVDIIDSPDLPAYLPGYKAAYLVDRNLPRASALALKQWVEAGGVLCLWPQAGTRDEFNEPLEIFPAPAGETKIGAGHVLRFGEAMGKRWWDATVKLCTAQGSDWPCAFEEETRNEVCRPALQLAGVSRPVSVSAAAVIADALVSDRGVAVPLVNLRGLLDQYGTRYLNLKVTLADGAGITRVYSSRCGELKLRHEAGGAVAVVMPLDCTDVVVFLKEH